MSIIYAIMAESRSKSRIINYTQLGDYELHELN